MLLFRSSRILNNQQRFLGAEPRVYMKNVQASAHHWKRLTITIYSYLHKKVKDVVLSINFAPTWVVITRETVSDWCSSMWRFHERVKILLDRFFHLCLVFRPQLANCYSDDKDSR